MDVLSKLSKPAAESTKRTAVRKLYAVMSGDGSRQATRKLYSRRKAQHIVKRARSMFGIDLYLTPVSIRR